MDGKLYAINADGTEKWSFITVAPITASPAIGEDGTIYVGCHGNYLYAISPDLTEKWNFMITGGVDSSPAMGGGRHHLHSFQRRQALRHRPGLVAHSWANSRRVSTDPSLS